MRLNFSRVESFKFTTFLAYIYEFVVNTSIITLYFNFFFDLPIMTTSPLINEINYCFFHSIKLYIKPINIIQAAVINKANINFGNINKNDINTAIIANIPIAFNSVRGSIPQLSSLPHKFSINVFI